MKINEIFYSIQGEGYWTGTPAVFIRFAGCNLNCSFCDTDFSYKLDLTMAEILLMLGEYPTNHIVLTGGEPALQIDNEFVGALRNKGYYIQIETNGTQELPNNLNWITISPKENWEIKIGNELKVIYQGQILEQYEDTDFDFYYLQPCEIEGKMNIEETIKIVKNNPKWKLSIQTQKLLKIR